MGALLLNSRGWARKWRKIHRMRERSPVTRFKSSVKVRSASEDRGERKYVPPPPVFTGVLPSTTRRLSKALLLLSFLRMRRRFPPKQRLEDATWACAGASLSYWILTHLDSVLTAHGYPFLMGAYASFSVLLFCLGSIVRPRNVILGTIASSGMAIASVFVLGSTKASLSVAMGGTVALQILLNCVFPPGGACAYTLVASDAFKSYGLAYLVFPHSVTMGIIVLVWLLLQYCRSRFVALGKKG